MHRFFWRPKEIAFIWKAICSESLGKTEYEIKIEETPEFIWLKSRKSSERDKNLSAYKYLLSFLVGSIAGLVVVTRNSCIHNDSKTDKRLRETHDNLDTEKTECFVGLLYVKRNPELASAVMEM